ncbi:MAG: peptidase T [Spirochaetaceae bacterium]
MSLQLDKAKLAEEALERFLRYVQVHTTSDRHSGTQPSSQRQFDLARMLAEELREIGVDDVTLTDNCYVIARIPGNSGSSLPSIGFLAHLDTAPDLSGENVRPQLWDNYDGSVIKLNDEHALDPAEYPVLEQYVGDTVITTDGTTLLGADDKAGVAEIMTAVSYLLGHPEIERGDLEVIFTPDEEIGHGVDGLPVKELNSPFCFTMDGGEEGTIEAECFNAYSVRVTFNGYVIHPGSAKNKMANATTMAGRFLSMLPQAESPEATEGRDGFYCPVEVRGDYGTAVVDLIVRDFEIEELRRRLEYVRSLAETVEKAFPRSSVTVEEEKQYLNMRDALKPYPFVIEFIQEAVSRTGLEPKLHAIRGGTDGARLTELGIPTPNIFAGGHNFHGRYEWIAKGALARATETILHLVVIWQERAEKHVT